MSILTSCCLLLVVTTIITMTTITTAVEGLPHRRLIRSASPIIVKPQAMRLEDHHHLPLPTTATTATATAVSITSDTSSITTNHPVIAAVVDRWRSQSKIGNRCSHDHMKIALCIEGGGMRGCVAAGSAAAINFLGLNDAIDVVYGSSVGSMIGCYFVSRQYSGHRIYHGTIQITDGYITCTALLPYIYHPFLCMHCSFSMYVCIYVCIYVCMYGCISPPLSLS